MILKMREDKTLAELVLFCKDVPVGRFHDSLYNLFAVATTCETNKDK